MRYLLLFFSFFLFGQKVENKFAVEGNTNIKSNFLWLVQTFGHKDYQFYNFIGGHKLKLSENGNFKFEGDIKIPSLFILMTDETVSEKFFLDNNKEQKITYLKDENNNRINDLYGGIIKVTNSESQKEYLEMKNKFLNSISEHINILKDKKKTIAMKIKEDSLLSEYVKKHPNSYVALWLLIDNFESYTPDQYQKRALKNFSKEIKNSDLYKIFLQKYNKTAAFILSKEDVFLRNESLKEEKLVLPESSKYTLLDFWFSYCAPCLKEMPDYLNIRNRYKSRGFEVISISTDQEKDLDNWRKKIQLLNLNWINYWDEKSLFSKKMVVNRFPTNFLIDNDGKIIKKDISAEELETFLEKNLK